MCSQLLHWSQRLHLLAQSRFTRKQNGCRGSIHTMHMYSSCHEAPPQLCLLLAEEKEAVFYFLTSLALSFSLLSEVLYIHLIVSLLAFIQSSPAEDLETI